MVRFVEREGYDGSYTTDSSVDTRPAQVEGHRMLLDIGHSEYWSGRAADAWRRARDGGTNLAFLASNTMAWRVRYAGAGHRIVAYKGLARGHVSDGERLYATDFHNGAVDVFDHAFQPVIVAGAFVDPMLPANYVPFGIQEVGGELFVTYAFRALPDDDDETAGPGLGLVSQFHNDGTFVRRVSSNGDLNDLVPGHAKDDASLRRRGGVVKMNDCLPRADQRLKCTLDQIFTSLHQHLKPNVLGRPVFLDEPAIKGVLRIRG